jgi:hypothetical protein
MISYLELARLALAQINAKASPAAQQIESVDSAVVSPDELPAEWCLQYEERAAIIEYDGHMPREHAELVALKSVQSANAFEPKCRNISHGDD